MDEKLYDFYRQLKFRIFRWWTFGRRQRSEEEFMKNVEEKFGDRNNIVLLALLWILAKSGSNEGIEAESDRCVGIGFRRKMAKPFTAVIDVPEAYTINEDLL